VYKKNERERKEMKEKKNGIKEKKRNKRA